MADIVAILEDNAGRIAAMRTCLTQMSNVAEILFFETAHDMVAWLDEHLGEVAMISLDHDLSLRDNAGRKVDCGTGRQVADYLAALPPTCPVIVHSSNDVCAQGMFFTLKDAGWPSSRVYPCDDTAWIANAWIEQVRRFVAEGWFVFSGDSLDEV